MIQNFDKLNIFKNKSRQNANLKKYNTIQASPNKEKPDSIVNTGLELKNYALKRKSSHHADFSNYAKFKNKINKIDFKNNIKSQCSSISKNQSNSFSRKKSSFREESMENEQPEIEFVSQKKAPEGKPFHKIKLTKSSLMKSQSSRNSEIKLTRAVLSFKENDLLKGAKMSLLEPSNSLKSSKKKKDSSEGKNHKLSRNNSSKLFNESKYYKNLD